MKAFAKANEKDLKASPVVKTILWIQSYDFLIYNSASVVVG
jgi:hypothetical protein